MAKQRLHKFLAAAGVGSRRRCEELIAEGRVMVDGVEVREMGVVVDPDSQVIRFDDEVVTAEKPVHFVVHKPVGYLCTSSDDWGRKTVISLVKDRHRRRLFTVGRLDEDSEGLIFVTNDGDFANKVAHPRYGLEKTYELKLHGYLDDDQLDRVRKGVWLSTGKSQPMFVRILKRSKQYTHVRVQLNEGKNRELRRIFAKVGHAVGRLVRTRIGPMELRGLKKGLSRRIGKAEVEAILAACESNKSEGDARTKGLRSSDSERFAGEKAKSKPVKLSKKEAARKKKRVVALGRSEGRRSRAEEAQAKKRGPAAGGKKKPARKKSGVGPKKSGFKKAPAGKKKAGRKKKGRS